jgi:hypothetical protein
VTVSRRAIVATLALAAGAAGWAAWRRLSEPAPSDEDRIRALFDEAARAVEDRRVSDAVSAVSERFRGDGLDRHGVKQLVASQVLRGEWVRVSVAGARVRVERDAASAVVDVVMARSGRGARLADLLPQDAAANRIDCRLEREGGEWRVVSASRRPISLAEALAGPPP